MTAAEGMRGPHWLGIDPCASPPLFPAAPGGRRMGTSRNLGGVNLYIFFSLFKLDVYRVQHYDKWHSIMSTMRNNTTALAKFQIMVRQCQVLSVLAWDRPGLIENPESALSKTNTRPSKNAFDSEKRSRPLKSGLEIGVGLETTALPQTATTI